MNKYTIIRHYPRDMLGADYVAVEVFVDDVFKIEYGDSYHDSGFEKALGFISGYSFAINSIYNPPIEYLETDRYSNEWDLDREQYGLTSAKEVRK